MFRGEQQILDELRQRVRRVDLVRAAEDAAARIVSTGIPALDALLPEQGLRRGTLWEWLSPEGGGAGGIIFYLLREVLGSRGVLVIVDQEREFYPPAAAAIGLNLEQVVVIRPRAPAEGLWALEQSLRCAGVTAVWCALNRLRDLEFRRLQLAAETGSAIGILQRPSRCRSQPSWADVRLLATPAGPACRAGPLTESEMLAPDLRFHPASGTCPRRIVHLELLQCRGGTADGAVDLEVCDATGDVRVVSALASPAAVRRSAGA